MALNFQDMHDPRITRVVLAVLIVASLAMVTVYAREGEGGVLHQVQGGHPPLLNGPAVQLSHLGGGD